MQRTIIDVSEHQGVINWEKVKPHIDGKTIVKEIAVPGRLINIVVK